jgi:hypothetical protein
VSTKGRGKEGNAERNESAQRYSALVILFMIPIRCRALPEFLLRHLSGAQEGAQQAPAPSPHTAAAHPQSWPGHLDSPTNAAPLPAPSNSSAAVPLGSASRLQGEGDEGQGTGKGRDSEAQTAPASAGVRARTPQQHVAYAAPQQQQHVTYGAPSSEAAIMFAVSLFLVWGSIFLFAPRLACRSC